MSLKNKRIIVTRATHQATKLVKMLGDKDALPLVYPCIDIAPPENDSALDSVLGKLKTYDWLILTSSNSVFAICRRIDALQIQIDWSKIKIASVGTSTSGAVEDLLGVKSTFISEEHTGKALACSLPQHEDMRVLLPQSNIAEMDTASILQNRGIDTTVVSAYRNVIGQGGDNIPEYLEEGRVDAITFTSGSTVDGFVRRIEKLTAYDLPVACIGSSTAEIAQNYGFRNIIVAKKITLKDMLEALEQYFAKSRRR